MFVASLMFGSLQAHALETAASTAGQICQELNGTLESPVVVDGSLRRACKAEHLVVDFDSNPSDDSLTKISWQGNRTPSLHSLLGVHHQEFRNAMHARVANRVGRQRSPHHRHHIETQHVIVNQFGNARFRTGEILFKGGQ